MCLLPASYLRVNVAECLDSEKGSPSELTVRRKLSSFDFFAKNFQTQLTEFVVQLRNFKNVSVKDERITFVSVF